MAQIKKIELEKDLFPIDEEEKELFQQINQNKFVAFSPDEVANKNLKQINQEAKQIIKSHQISIKMPGDLLFVIKQKAAKEWLPYQTYIKHILHKAVMED